MADSSTADLGKGKRITGGDRSTLADELRKRYDGGESIRSLAESTKRSYGFVHRLLSESGATLRSRGGANRNSKKACPRRTSLTAGSGRTGTAPSSPSPSTAPTSSTL